MTIQKSASNGKVATGPKGKLLMGHFSLFRQDPIRFFLDAWHNHGDVSRFRLGPLTGHLLIHPDHVKHVLQDNNKNYSRREIYRSLRLIMGDSLLTSDGDFWLRQRRIAQPAFHRRHIASFARKIVSATQDMLDNWQSSKSKTLDIYSEMMKVTLKIVSLTFFCSELIGDHERIERLSHVVNDYINYRNNNFFPIPPAVPTPRNLRFRKAMQYFDELLYQFIDEHRRDGEKESLLSMLMAAKDEETGEMMNDLQLRNELITLFAAGHETTALTLTWTLYLLSRHPGERRKLFAEVDEVLAGRPATFDDLARLPYTLQVIKEAMRLYPPAWVIARILRRNDEIGGYHLPAKSLVFVSPYVTHRHPEFWSNPEGFDPQRFASKEIAAHPRFAYFPFGGGPHLCIGNEFAMMEAQLIVATIIQRYQLDLVPGHPIQLRPLITLHPKYGMNMAVTRR